MQDSVLKAFAAEFAKIEDDAERARMLSRVKMIAAKQAPDSAFEAPIRTLGEYLASTIQIPPVIVEPALVVRGGLNATIGRAGKGKTVMNLNRCLRWAAGKPLFDGWCDGEGNPHLMPVKPLRILIIENEGAAGMFHKQIGLMLNAPNFLTDEDREACRENVLVWGEGGYSGLKFDDANKLNEVRAGVEKHEPDIVFIEPFRSLWAGEENSATEMNVVVDALIALATDYNLATLISHHERKSGPGDDGEKMSAGRGSTVLEGAVTVMENFEATKGGEFRELSWSKARHEPPPNPVRMEWVKESWWYSYVPEERLGDSILSAVRANGDEPMSISDLHDVLEEPKQKLRDMCKRLVEDGKLKMMPSVPTERGSTGPRYRVPANEEAEGGLGF